ncbi:hypothetical protein [Manganibacter manganicus]|uniref:hypothetical protein n=1 Tax=Manganibacter manganicus TaxID=1873176 RepID=UPI001117B640|nr:hypothetical protein [Pseudaminobacter manganicus]
MSVHLAEGKAKLMRIKRPREQHRHEIGYRVRLLPASGFNQIAAFLVMAGQLSAALVKPMEGQLMPRQDKHLIRDIPCDVFERSEIEAERIALRIDRPDADIGCDAGDDLVGRQKGIFRGAVEHRGP